MPQPLQGVKDMIIVPLLSVIMVGASMLIVNVPFAYLNIGINMGITAMAGMSYLVVLLGAIVSAFMAIDMGGPINKATHYAVLGILTNVLNDPLHTPADLVIPEQLMAANIVGIMVPPVMIALCT